MAADLLAAHRATPASPWVRMLLAHPSERVRHRGVLLSAEFGLTEVVPKLRSLVGSDVRRPRDEAVVALARLDSDARGFLAPLLGSSDPGLRGAAVAALVPGELRDGAHGPATAALDALVQQLDASEGERRELARLLGRLPGTRWAAGLDRLVDDPDPGVRRLAIAAAGECRRLQLVPRLLEFLGDRAYRTEARRALAAMGEPIVEAVAAALGDRTRPLALRWELPRLLRYIGTPRAAQALLDGHAGGDPFLRYRIALALSHLRRHHEELQFDRGRVLEAVVRRVEAYGYYLPIYRDLQRALGDGAIVVRALRGRLDQGGEMVFRLLGLVYPLRSMMNVYNRFARGEPRERAYALELFENLVDEDVRDRIVPLAERWHRLPSGEGSAERAPGRLEELAGSKDPVLRACARYAAGHAGGGLSAGRIEEDAVSDSVVQKVFLLEGVRIFEKCSVDDLTALASIAEERRFPAGTVIYRENDPGDALFVLVEGHVLAEKEGRTILEVREKEAFGDVSLLDGEPRPASARALEDSRALVIDRQDFLDLLSDRPELLKGLFAVLTRQMRQVLELAAPQRGGGAG